MDNDKVTRYAQERAEYYMAEWEKDEAISDQIPRRAAERNMSVYDFKAWHIANDTERFMQDIRMLLFYIENKDLAMLSPATNNGRLHTGNVHSRKVFEQETGIRLPKTKRDTITTLEAWAKVV